MIKEHTSTIEHRKGDSETFRFNAIRDDLPYTIPEDEIYFFTVKKTSDENSPELIKKEIKSNGESFIEFSIDKSDTLNMGFGNYVWDLRCKSGDVITTPITKKNFILAEVVGNV